MSKLSPRQLAGLETLKRLASFVAHRIAEDRLPQVAGSLTFTTLLSLVPLLTVAFALFTAFPVFSSFQDALQGFLSNHLMPEHLNRQIFAYLAQFASKAKSLTAAGSVFLVITAVMTMMTVEAAFNVIWRVRKPRPLGQRVLAYWALLTLAPLLVGISLTISSYLFTQSLTITGLTTISAMRKWLLTFAAFPLQAIALTLFYRFLPNTPVTWRDALTGGAGAAFAFEIAKRAFGYYVRHIPTYTAVYGTFATIPIFLLWTYMSWFVVLAGAMMTSVLPAVRVGEFRRVRFAGSDLMDALELLSRLIEMQGASRAGATAARLSTMTRCDLPTTQRLLNVMDEREWIARLQNDTETAPRYVIVANPEQLTLGHLFDALVIEREGLMRHLAHDDMHVDPGLLLSALDSEQFDVSLAALTHRRRIGAGSEEMPDLARERFGRLSRRRGVRAKKAQKRGI